MESKCVFYLIFVLFFPPHLEPIIGLAFDGWLVEGKCPESSGGQAPRRTLDEPLNKLLDFRPEMGDAVANFAVEFHEDEDDRTEVFDKHHGRIVGNDKHKVQLVNDVTELRLFDDDVTSNKVIVNVQVT